MRLTDPVADMLTRVRNALPAPAPESRYPGFAVEAGDCRILKEEEGYISNFKPTEEEGHKVIRIYLENPAPTTRPPSPRSSVCLTRDAASTCVVRKFPRVGRYGGKNILTTPRGVMTGRQARKEGVGGELLCEIY